MAIEMARFRDQSLFETGNPGRLAVPGFMTVFMVVVFSLPAVMLVATTWKDVSASPWIVPIWIASFFPLAVLYTLKRLMTRYALRVHADGAAEVVYPFKTVRFPAGAIRAARVRQVPLQRGQGFRTWVDLLDEDREAVTTVAASAFSEEQWSGFFAALRRARPDFVVARSI